MAINFNKYKSLQNSAEINSSNVSGEVYASLAHSEAIILAALIQAESQAVSSDRPRESKGYLTQYSPNR